jgi:S-adenosyl-L-methionine hydrolase (adenosine-forming)
MNRIITLTTDFGVGDGYVGTMKGVILSINPQATIVDITHEIAPQNIEQGAFLFASSYKYFPANTIHVVVVDPGVGGARRPIAIQNGETLFVGPDNGILPMAIWGRPVLDDATVHESLPWAAGRPPRMARMGNLPFLSFTAIVHLNNPAYWLPTVSNTFHGRDIFAPCAAHLSLGVPIQALGDPIRQLTRVGPVPNVRRLTDKALGRVIHIDHFGNVITNITEQALSGLDRERIVVEVGGKQLTGLKRTYSDVGSGQPLALVGSAGHVEIALRNGNAARELGIRMGDGVVVSVAG